MRLRTGQELPISVEAYEVVQRIIDRNGYDLSKVDQARWSTLEEVDRASDAVFRALCPIIERGQEK